MLTCEAMSAPAASRIPRPAGTNPTADDTTLAHSKTAAEETVYSMSIASKLSIKRHQAINTVSSSISEPSAIHRKRLSNLLICITDSAQQAIPSARNPAGNRAFCRSSDAMPARMKSQPAQSTPAARVVRVAWDIATRREAKSATRVADCPEWAIDWPRTRSMLLGYSPQNSAVNHGFWRSANIRPHCRRLMAQ